MEENPGKKQRLFVVLSISSLVFGTKAIVSLLVRTKRKEAANEEWNTAERVGL